jgi:hypothetical protein
VQPAPVRITLRTGSVQKSFFLCSIVVYVHLFKIHCYRVNHTTDITLLKDIISASPEMADTA